MTMTFSRRGFFGVTAAAVSAGCFLAGRGVFADGVVSSFPSNIYKSRITDSPTDKYCESLKSAGFAGMEVTKWNIPPSEARKVRQLVESHDLRIHSLMRAWVDFNKPDRYKADIESVKTALRAASAYGADTVLLVTSRVSGMKMPEAWDFDVDFDPATLKVKTVAQGDNASYANYIAAQNLATECSIRAVESLIPVAAREGVRIAIENVWNNLWCTPKFFAAFCKYFDNTWVGSYLDLGNHTKYSRCEEWIKELGSNILKLHIKGYKITEVKGKLGGGVGNWSAIDKASIDWRSVRKALSDARYNGWVSVEENEKGYTDQTYSKILDKIIDGE
ncbi:MAG: sugar phosphate isomerase/epimerase [Planctomycetaceae bacterium]|jgi:hexulose-6-phosphate isomerase|nr:sugar phosphate isomerase/epimerase [Planctomycetaceae bacterium]